MSRAELRDPVDLVNSGAVADLLAERHSRLGHGATDDTEQASPG